MESCPKLPVSVSMTREVVVLVAVYRYQAVDDVAGLSPM